MAFGFLKKIFGDPIVKKVNKYKEVADKINQLEAEYSKLSDEDLKNKTFLFREMIKKECEGITDNAEKLKREREILDRILPEAFAVVREASKRTLGLRHFDVQLIGGMVLHDGKIAEMRTGEGKTLVSTAPAYLNALTGRGVHVITVNDYLAKRDSELMGKIHKFLGLTVGCIQNHLSSHERRKAYSCDITYGTNNEFGFDYLRDNMATDIQDCVQRELNFGVVDEVDSILIDEARTPLIISGAIDDTYDLYEKFQQIVNVFHGKNKDYTAKKSLFIDEDAPDEEADCDYIIDEKAKNVILTERGILKAQEVLGINDLFGEEYQGYAHHLTISLKAKELYRRDVEYVVKLNEEGEEEVCIVDEFTGRLMPGRRYSDGLHQAIEAKEGVRIQEESQTLATITFQNYFRMYNKLSGMTGTALTEEAEFGKIYKLDVVPIPTHRPMIREDVADVIYKNIEQKFKAIAEEVKELNKNGRPVLVGTVSIEKSEYLGSLLRKKGVPHKVLNAKNHEKEAEIIAQAGRLGAVTISTNMAGRGTDILLGGNAEFLIKEEFRRKGLSIDEVPENEYKDVEQKIKAQIDEEHKKVAELGGLVVIGTERHESRRIDNQLRGRSGRQGDPGMSKFFLSLEDDLMRLFGGDRISRLMEFLKIEDDTAIDAPSVTKAIENAQKKVELYHFGIRKSVLEYDEVMNSQRKIIYAQRRKILEGDNIKPVVEEMIKRCVEDVVEKYANINIPEDEWDLAGMLLEVAEMIPMLSILEQKELEGREKPDLINYLQEQALSAYEAKENTIGSESMRNVERMIILRIIDQKWIDHLHEMDALREGIGLRAYGQKDPLVEYKKEGRELFDHMMLGIRHESVMTLFHIQIEYQMPMMSV
ncbi:MAG: preprotein translocase subunit SecA [Candidatus Sericytochromatia bacterium]